MSLSSSNTVILSCGLVHTVWIQAKVFTRISISRAKEAWNFIIHHWNSVPPFPVAINLIVEPNVYTSSNCKVCSPSSIKIGLDNCVSSGHISLLWYWHSCVYFPGVNVSFFLTLSSRETELDTFWESGICQGRNSNSWGDRICVLETFSDRPWAGWWGGCRFSEGKWAISRQSIAVVLWQNKGRFLNLLHYTVL